MALDTAGGRPVERAQARALRWPRTPSVFVVKPGLVAQLDHREPLTIVRGPRGYGKTSLVSHWVRTLPDDVAVVWVRGRSPLGADDPTGQTLWELVAEAMVSAGILAAPEQGVAGRSAVIQALSASEREICLVVDDFDDLSEPHVESEILGLLRRFSWLSMVLCMSEVASVETVLAATIDSVVIRPVDLLLDAEETGDLAERLGVVLSVDETRALHRETAGWPALVRAILMNGAAPHPVRGGTTIDLQAGGPFLHSVWSELRDRRIQRLILRTAILDEFTAAGAAYCSGLRDVESALQVLVGTGMLTTEIYQDSVVYRYLPVVRRACLESLPRLDPRQFRVASRRAAQSSTVLGRCAVALGLLTRASLWTDVVELVDAYWVELVAESPDELAAAVAAMPKEVLEGHARLVIARDHLLPLHKPAGEGTERLPGHVLDLAAVGPSHGGGLGDVFALPGVTEAMEQSLAQIAMLRITGDFTVGMPMVRDHDDVLFQVEDLRHDVRDELAPVLHEWAVTRLLAADMPGALSAFREAAELAGEHHHPAIVREASVGAALACAMLGYLDAAEAWLVAADRAPGGYEQESTAVKIVATVRGIIALERIDLEAMAGAASFDVPEASGEFRALAVLIRAQVALFDGSHFQILGQIEAYRDDEPPSGLGEALLVAATVDLNLAIGHFSRARNAIAGVPQNYEISGLARARTEYFSGEFARAVDVATLWLKTRIYAPARRLDFLLILAGAEHARGRRYEAAVALEEAVAISLATGLVRAFLKVPRATLTDLVIEVPRIAGILAHDRLADAAELFPPPTASAQLSERELEVLESLALHPSLAGVARSLYLSANTVKTHLRSIYRKLGTHSSAETVERAWELGLISRPD